MHVVDQEREVLGKEDCTVRLKCMMCDEGF